MELKLEDFDKQSDQNLNLENFDEENEVFFSLEELDKETDKKIILENLEKNTEKTLSLENSEKIAETEIASGFIDRESGKENQEKIKKLRRTEKPLWGFLWRFFACCVLINLSIWAYFHFAKEVSVREWVQQMRSEIQAMMNKEDDKTGKYNQNLDTVIPDKKEKQDKIARERIGQPERQKQRGGANLTPPNASTSKRTGKTVAIYSWTNEKGGKVYSNIGFPEGEKYTDPKIEWQ